MFQYLIDHCRKNMLQETLNNRSSEGWKLHTMFEQPSGYVLVMERWDHGVEELTVETETLTPVVAPKQKKTPKSRELAFVKSADGGE